MKNPVMLALSVFIISCASSGKNSGDSNCTPVTPWENLSPFIGKCVIIKGDVTDNGYLSVKDYWIPIPELWKYRGDKVSVTGIVQTRKESTGSSNEQQSERGVYYIKVKSIEKLK